MFFSTLFTVDVSLFTLLFIPHLRRSSPHLPLHFFALSVHVHLWHLSTFCLLPHSYQPNPFPIIVQSPHLYFKSQTEEAPERAKRLSPISRLCLIFYKPHVDASQNMLHPCIGLWSVRFLLVDGCGHRLCLPLKSLMCLYCKRNPLWVRVNSITSLPDLKKAFGLVTSMNNFFCFA